MFHFLCVFVIVDPFEIGCKVPLALKILTSLYSD